MHPMQNGNANNTVENNILKICKSFKFSIFNIKYISCDGDHFYDSFFNLQFDKLIKAYLNGKKDLLFQLIKDLELIWISDLLH